MDNKTRIEKEAREYAGLPLYASEETRAMFDAYIAGATANYNKGWNDAIEACKKQLSSTTEVDKILESLKIANR